MSNNPWPQGGAPGDWAPGPPVAYHMRPNGLGRSTLTSSPPLQQQRFAEMARYHPNAQYAQARYQPETRAYTAHSRTGSSPAASAEFSDSRAAASRSAHPPVASPPVRPRAAQNVSPPVAHSMLHAIPAPKYMHAPPYSVPPPAAHSVHATELVPAPIMDRVLIQATLDNEHFAVVNVTGLESAPRIKQCILEKLGFFHTELARWQLFRTEIGLTNMHNTPPIDDDTLLALCLQLGDNKGTVKFLVQEAAAALPAYAVDARARIPSTSPEPVRAPELHPVTPRHARGAANRMSIPSPGSDHALGTYAGWQPLLSTPASNAQPSLAPPTSSPEYADRRASMELKQHGAPPSLQPSHPAALQTMPLTPVHGTDTFLHSLAAPNTTSPMVEQASLPMQLSVSQQMPVRPDKIWPKSSTVARDGSHSTPIPTSAPSCEETTVYPLFKSASNSEERTGRILPPAPAPTESSQSPSSHRSSGVFDAPMERSRALWNDPVSAMSTYSAATTLSEENSREDTRLARVRHMMDQARLLDQHNDCASFASFSEDTLGGTFAQPLDSHTLVPGSDTYRAERTIMPSQGTLTPTHGARPVLTISINKPNAQTDPTSQRSSSGIDRRGSFANHDANWAFRPPAEQLYEQLDDLFPRHDLDKPLSDAASPVSNWKHSSASSNASSSSSNASATSTSAPAKGRGLARGPHHSIRVIAQNRKRFLDSTRHAERREAKRDQAVLDRRRSTKLWGGQMVEMKTNEADSVGVVPDATIGPELEPNTRPVFKWVKGDLIGKGTYGRVYLALNATTGEMIAVKQVELPRTRADRDSNRQRDVVAALKSEIATLKDLDHPNVVTCLGFEETRDTLSIFLEYVPGGSIGSCLRKHGKFDEDSTSSFLNQTLQGLAYLHKQGILHRDLKADNLLVDYHGTCKISDFGTVRRSEDIYSNVENMSLQGSIFWMAPEVMSLSPKGYSAKVDIWSLGCVVLEMLAGRRPWSDEEAVQAMFKIGAERRAPPIPSDCKLSKPAAHFLRNCFEIDPYKRPTAARLLEHVFAWPSPEYRFEHTPLGRALAQ
ncbi:mitogen-activated protein kinase kinase kinase [Malassezia vespertilionis]|uniref:Protein kinase domain-containing protein n=1 Tax=Malassezia vespertilionis TaxID=2020962 RepID=A0A2N1JFC4_9BASI|nr:mitogen-activated protein kinase kinase kinase [Malassezia vespertilionis]PKI85216.1 hypothetical protein MVES_001205 [Malassezia vespertilionis]WFD05946.1 mitogen-activated protein kinase kinase kinase [Malassezia vespertilionis]